MWSKAVFRVIPKNAENPQMPVCQGVPTFWLWQVGWMPIRSQIKRDTNFATPGYSLFCHDTTESGKNKDFSVCGHLCGQSCFYAVFGNQGKSRKRRCHKALRCFALPRPGYRHGTPKCGTVPTPPYPDRGGGTPPDHGRRTLTISDFLRSCKGEISRSERPSEPPHGR